MDCQSRRLVSPVGGAVAMLAAALLSLVAPGDVEAQQPYYPYPCPFVSGGRDLVGAGSEDGWVFDPRTGVWSADAGDGVTFGQWGDLPTPGDFNGDEVDDHAIWRASTGTWFVKCSTLSNCPLGVISLQFGAAGDIPLPADFNNDGFTDYGIWRPDDGAWWVLSGADRFTPLVNNVKWGQYSDCPVPSRLDGEGAGPLELNIWRPANGVWYYGKQLDGGGAGVATAWGAYGDIPFSVDGDMDGDGDIVVYRPSAGMWFGMNPAYTVAWGLPGDLPMPISGDAGSGFFHVLQVYRPSDQIIYHCVNPSGASCGGTTVSGPLGGPGVVPIVGGTR